MASLTEEMQVADLAPSVRGLAQKLGGIAQGVANDAVDDFLSGKEVNWESLGTSAFGHTLDAIHPLLGTAVQIGQGLVQTYQGLEQSLGVLLDPNASADEIQQAALTGLFQVSNFAFDKVTSRFNPGQYVQMLGHQALQGTRLGVLEHVAAWGLDKIAAATTRRAQSTLADGKQLINQQIQLGFCGEEKCFPAGTIVVARWSVEQPQEDPAAATGRVPIDQLVLSERLAQKDAGSRACQLTGHQLSDAVLWSARSEHWWVVSRDETSGKLVWQRVRTTSINETNELVRIALSDASGHVVERIEATAEHPFFTTSGLKKAGDLGIGTQIITRAGPTLTVAEVARIKLGEQAPVFNFEVEGSEVTTNKHSYFVGDLLGGISVHNGANCDGGDLGLTKAGLKRQRKKGGGPRNNDKTNKLELLLAKRLRAEGWTVTHGGFPDLVQEKIRDEGAPPTGKRGRQPGTLLPYITAEKDGTTLRIQTITTEHAEGWLMFHLR